MTLSVDSVRLEDMIPLLVITFVVAFHVALFVAA